MIAKVPAAEGAGGRAIKVAPYADGQRAMGGGADGGRREGRHMIAKVLVAGGASGRAIKVAPYVT